MVPVNPIPPPFQILVLACNTIVHHPYMLPCVHTENGIDMQATGCQSGAIVRVKTHGSSMLITDRGFRRLRVHVDGLSSGVSRGIR